MKTGQDSNSAHLPISQLSDYNCADIIESLPAAIYTCDRSGTITFFNEAAVDLWGRRPVVGHDFWCGSWKIYNPDGSPLETDKCPMAVTLTEGRAVLGQEIIIERPDGQRINVLPHPRPLFNADGDLTGAINMLVDISETRVKEVHLLASEQRYKNLSESLEQKVDERTATLRKSEERYHKMVEEVEDYAILLLDRDGNVQNWNLGAQKIKGYTEQEIIGKNFSIFYLQQDRDEKLPQALINQAVEHGKAMHEGWRLRKNGEKFWGFIVITALHDSEGNIMGFSKVTRDLSERKAFEDQMKQYAKDIEFRNRQLEEYAHIASHDLQEPLRKIRTFVELLENNIHNPEILSKYLEKIDSSATRMTALIKDILAYSQLSQSDMQFEPIDLNKIVKSVTEDFELLIEEKNAHIAYSDLTPVNGISIQLQQLFSNLISNALKFSGANALIEISTMSADADEISKFSQLKKDRNYIKIIVKDNGSGFEPQYAEQVFKLFHRLHSEEKGTGIGLALCKKIVENHSGYITVKSEVNRGTEFTIYLPVS